MRRYVGSTSGTAAAHVVEVYDGNRLVGTLRHLVKHSPSGFAWGYAGSGPADLARSLLADHLGPAAVCAGCAGTGRQVWDDATMEFRRAGTHDGDYVACGDCWGEKVALPAGVYQRFKFDVIARLPQSGSWELTAADIDAWLAANALR